MRSRTLFLATGALLAACAQPVGPAPLPEPRPGEAPFVPATKLGEAAITTRSEGGWTYRSTVNASARGSDWGGAPGAPAASTAAPRADAKDLLEVEAAAGGGDAPAKGGPASDPAAPGERRSLRTRDELAEAKSKAGEPAGASLGPGASHVAHQLRAGATDDNADFQAYLKFLGEWEARPGMKGAYQPLDVRDRKLVRVVDGAGRPVPAASVAVIDEEKDRTVGRATTYGDGRAPIYPHAALAADQSAAAPPSGWIVEVRAGDRSVRTRWDGRGDEFTVTLAGAASAPELVPIDVAFLIDTTGSMGDEIASIQASLLRVTEQIRNLSRESNLRVGTVLYRDVGDEYLTATYPLTSDVGELDKALRSVTANGGGDGPESLNQGLAETVGGLAWRDGAAKVAFLVADAPPHMDYAGDTPYGVTLTAAIGKGLRIHTVAASGIDAVGSLVFRQIAQFTRGKFVFIEYGGSIQKSAASHGVAGAVKNDNLEDILFEQIRDEVARWGR